MLVFNYYVDGVYTTTQFETCLNSETQHVFPLKVICASLGIEMNTQIRVRANEKLKIGGKGQATAHCTLDVLHDMFTDLTTPKAFSQLKPHSKLVVVEYYKHFCESMRWQIAPQKESDAFVDLDLTDVGSVGVNVYRRDLAFAGLPPSLISMLSESSPDSVSLIDIVQTQDFPDMGEFGRGKPSVQRIVKYQAEPTEYVQGSLLRYLKNNKAQLKLHFAKANPTHALSKPKMTADEEVYGYKGINKHGEALWTGIRKVEPVPVVNEWDNEPIYIGKIR